MLRPGERLLAGQQAEEGDGLHRAGQGGLLDVVVQRNLGGAEGSAVEMGDEGIAFEDEAVLFRSQREGLAAALAFQPGRTGAPVAVRGVVEGFAGQVDTGLVPVRRTRRRAEGGAVAAFFPGVGSVDLRVTLFEPPF